MLDMAGGGAACAPAVKIRLSADPPKLTNAGRRAPWMRELRPMLVRSCSALSLVSLLAACGEERETITPTVGPITESVYASGVVKAEGQYRSSHGERHGERLLVNEGDTVKAGQALLSIDDRNSSLGHPAMPRPSCACWSRTPATPAPCWRNYGRPCSRPGTGTRWTA
jgi:hypothetical protein